MQVISPRQRLTPMGPLPVRVRTEVAELHETRLPASIVDELRHRPASGESLESVFAEVERFAATLSD